MENQEKILILGLGNIILTDDGIGPRLVEDLSARLHSPLITWETANLGGMELLELFRPYATVFIIDAIKTGTREPGAVYYLTPASFKETLHVSNFHDISFLTALELGRQLKMEVPEHIHIIAVEIIEDLVFDDSLSPELEKKYPLILADVESMVRELLSPNPD